MGTKWVMLIKLLVWFQGHSKNADVLYSVINVIIIITFSKNCGNIKGYPERIHNLVGKIGVKIVDFSIIHDGTLWAKFLVLCGLLILDLVSQVIV